MYKKTILNGILGVCLTIPALSATAGFESGIPAGWTGVGNFGTITGIDGDVATPPNGSTSYGYVTTSGGVYGSTPFGIGGTTNGSNLKSTVFTAAAGDPLNFYFNYITSDGSGFADFGYAQLLNAADLTQAALIFTARTQPDGNIIPGFGLPPIDATVPVAPIIDGQTNWSPLGGSSGACFNGVGNGCGQTGWVLSAFNIAVAGNYLIEFGVANFSDTAFDSGLAFDGITVAGVPITPPSEVPVPAALPLMASALAAFGLSRRRTSTKI